MSDFKLFRLPLNHSFRPFDCGDKELNEFITTAAIPHQKDLVTVTYVMENEKDTIAFFSLLNDKISYVQFDNTKKYRKYIRDKMPRGKRYDSYPAMKIGRLGVHKSYSKLGIGTSILDYLKKLFVTDNRTGCKFITVDAYAGSVPFYQKCGFVLMTEADKDKDSRQMYFELKPIEE